MRIQHLTYRIPKIGHEAKVKLLLLFAVIWANPYLSYAQGPPTYYSYHDNSVMDLGSGVDPQNPYERKNQCLEFEPYPLDEDAALVTFQALKMAKNKEDLRIQLGIDSKAAARYLLFKAEGDQKIDFTRVESSDSATLIIQFYTEFGRRGVRKIKYSTHAQKLIDNNQFDQFRRDCGSQYVSVMRRGASVAAVITVHNINSSTKAQLSGGIGVGIDLKHFGGQLKSKVSSTLDTALQTGELEIQAFSNGGNGFGDFKINLDNFVRSGTSDIFASIVKSISEYIGRFNATNAVPIGFHVTRYEGFNEQRRDLWNEHKDSKLMSLVDEYEQVEKDRKTVDGIVRGSDPRNDVLSPQQISSLKPLLTQLVLRSTRIMSVYTNCLDAPVTQLQRCDIEPSNLKIPDYLYPIEKMPSTFAVIVDREPLPRSKAAEVLEDPGSGSLLEKVNIRQPGAKSAYTAVSFNSPYLSHISIIIRFYGKEYLRSVFYPGKSLGDTIVSNRGNSSYIVLQADPKTTVDRSLINEVHRWYYQNICVAAALGKPGLPAHFGGGDIIARARNRYGYTRDFQIATIQVYEGKPGINIMLSPTSGQKPIQRHLSEICRPSPPQLPDNLLMVSGEPNASDEFVYDPFGSRYTDKPTVCIVNNTAYPEGAIIDVGSQKRVCSNGELRDVK